VSRNSFKKSNSGPVLSREAAARQGQAVRAATAALSDTDAARLFLNSHHVGLRGRPLDLAVASAGGLKEVETAICIEARRSAQSS
jgi:hypothetical protein